MMSLLSLSLSLSSLRSSETYQQKGNGRSISHRAPEDTKYFRKCSYKPIEPINSPPTGYSPLPAHLSCSFFFIHIRQY